MTLTIRLLLLALALLATACGEGKTLAPRQTPATPMSSPAQLETATFGGGCFWCTEAIFLQVEGVHRVVSGYSGGTAKNPTYKEVCTGATGHAEVIQIHYDPAAVRFETLLEIFFKTHDPTTLNRQGADEGTQYRSVVFYHSEEQARITREVIADLTKAQVWPDPIVTQVEAFSVFYPAEDYHQNYYNQNTEQGYCRAVITPKVEKFRKVFADRLKATAK